MTKKTYQTNVEPGAFPFPIINGPKESRYLTWIRNHSNYMAVRGVLDYVRAAAVLVRGILVNFLVILPYLLAFSLAVALWYFYVKQFQTTFVVLIAGVIVVALFPLLTPLFRIIRHRQRIETGSDSSVWLRDKFERFFGSVFLLILAVVAFESITFFLDYFHDLVQGNILGWPQFATVAAAAVALFTAADKLMNVLGGAAKKIAILAVGALGLLVPLLVILFVSDFLVFSLPDPVWTKRVDMAFGIIRWVIVLAILAGLIFRALGLKELALAIIALIAAIAIGNTIEETGWGAYDKKYDHEAGLHFLSIDDKNLASRARRKIPDLIYDSAKQPGPRVTELREHLESRRTYNTHFYSLLGDGRRPFGSKELDEFSAVFPSLLGLVDFQDEVGIDARTKIEELAERIRLAQLDAVIEIDESAELIKWVLQKDANCLRYVASNLDVDKLLCGKPLDFVIEEIVVTLEPERLQLKDLGDLLWDPSIERLNRIVRLTGKTVYDYLSLDEISDLGASRKSDVRDDPAKIAFEELAQTTDQVLEELEEETLDVLWKHLDDPYDDDVFMWLENRKTSIFEANGGPDDVAQEWLHNKYSEAWEEFDEMHERMWDVIIKRNSAAWHAFDKQQLDDRVHVLYEGLFSGESIESIARRLNIRDHYELWELARNPESTVLELVVIAMTLDEYSTHDIAEVLGIEPKTVWSAKRPDLGTLYTLLALKMRLESPDFIEDIAADLRISEESVKFRIANAPPAILEVAALKMKLNYMPVQEIAADLMIGEDRVKAIISKAPPAFYEAPVLELALDGVPVIGIARELELEERTVKALLAKAPPELLEFVVLQKKLDSYPLNKDRYSIDEVGAALGIKQRTVRSILAQAPPVFQELLVLEMVLNGYSIDDISANLEIKEEAIETIIAHAPLTFYETRVFRMILGGVSKYDIAEALGIEEDAVNSLVALYQRKIDEVSKKQARVQEFSNAIDDLGLAQLGELLLAARTELATTAFYSRGDYPDIYNSKLAESVRLSGMQVHFPFVLIFAVLLWVLAWLTADVNLTSIHGLYRDRLAAAFLVGEDTKGDVDIEKDLDLEEICRYEAGSTAPYHLINTALNLQSSKDIGLRDRNSGYFVFSKKFIGGKRTQYCRSENMEAVFPQMGLATAMAISAAAASPNMGRATSPALVAIMALLNIRLGCWIPNPGRLEEWISAKKGAAKKEKGYSFDEVFTEELVEITRRWENYKPYPDRYLSTFKKDQKKPTPRHGLLGIGFSGGGIRSATINLGITQVLNRRGIFDHIDYMSTVSGGGYLGSSISALMRRKTKTVSDVTGTVHREKNDAGEEVVRISPKPEWMIGPTRQLWRHEDDPREYRYASDASITVQDRDKVKKGKRLLQSGTTRNDKLKSFGAFFRWQVRPGALLREIGGRLDENHRWVNVSDGGHIENLAGIELLRRRCKYVIIGDGEADPEHQFNGLATLVRSARIDLGIEIKINLDELRLAEKGKRKGLAQRHWAIGRIDYPPPDHKDSGYLLYFKSSVTGDEDEVIKQYRLASPSFPHESTADQFFGEGQFEAYRSLGQHIAEQVIKESNLPGALDDDMSFDEFETWIETLWENRARKKSKSRNA